MNILFIDDHKIFREGAGSLIEKLPLCSTLHYGGSVNDAINALDSLDLDILIFDLTLTDGSGIDILSHVNREKIPVKTVCLTINEELSVLYKLFSLGLTGFVTKNSGLMELENCLTNLSKGMIYIDQIMIKKMIRFRGKRISTGDAPGILSPREQQIYEQLIKEEGINDIAIKLCISQKTVENHKSSIYRKLGIKDKLSLLRFAAGEEMPDA
ncbi:MAG: response regulator transcription factor [Spirochaetales bacterium]|nr:response regulator transcription factor [Spirochaetales bacterium]